jgi:hypothetical protein
MGGFSLIVSRDLRDLAGAAAFRAAAVLLAALAIALAAAAAAVIAASAAPRGAAPDAPTLVGTMLYFATLLPFLVFLWAFAGPSLIKEKASGHLETLLATPLNEKTLWLAKTATIVLPGLAAAALSSALIGVAAAIASRALPAGAIFAIAPQAALICLLGNPLLLSGLGALTVLIALRASPDSAIIPSFVLGFGLMSIVPVGTGLGFIDLSSWTFAAAYLGAGALEWIIVLALERGMTKERIVLSSRED